jgi:hypothetical protein
MSGELYGISMPQRWPANRADAAPYLPFPQPKYEPIPPVTTMGTVLHTVDGMTEVEFPAAVAHVRLDDEVEPGTKVLRVQDADGERFEVVR